MRVWLQPLCPGLPHSPPLHESPRLQMSLIFYTVLGWFTCPAQDCGIRHLGRRSARFQSACRGDDTFGTRGARRAGCESQKRGWIFIEKLFLAIWDRNVWGPVMVHDEKRIVFSKRNPFLRNIVRAAVGVPQKAARAGRLRERGDAGQGRKLPKATLAIRQACDQA